ncbi:MAG: cytochrome C, partial [Bacteroidetes bacterium]
HSNESTYPWYANIAPVKWWIYDHINEGREDLNFSVWNTLSKADQAEALDDIATAVMEGEMPLKPYPVTHPKAKLSEADRQSISDWTEILAEKLFE